MRSSRRPRAWITLFVSKASATASNNSFIPSADKAETNLKVAFIDFA